MGLGARGGKMYLDFFEFRKKPFHITPDPEFLFLGPSHKKAYDAILCGIKQRRGLVAVTGEAGVGKTTILRSYLDGIDPEKVRAVYILNAVYSFDHLLKQIVLDLGIQAVGGSTLQIVESLWGYLTDEYKNDRNVVLIIDEAQNMPVGTLERLGMLLNLKISRERLLQIILVGQPELENKLNLPELRQLKKRIAIQCHIDAFQPDESFAYIRHRLMKASSFHVTVFTKRALKLIVEEADGIPRTINILCDNALITGFGYQRNPVNYKIVKEVIADLRGRQPKGSFWWRFVWVPTLAVFSALVLFASMAVLVPKKIPPAETEILTAKAPQLPVGAETTKEPEIRHPVPSVPWEEPQSSTIENPAAGGGKSVSPAVLASGPAQVAGQAQTSEAEIAPVPKDEGAPAGKGVTAAETAKESEGEPPVPSVPKAEPQSLTPDSPAAGGDKSISPAVLASGPVQVAGQAQTSEAEIAPVPKNAGAPAYEGINTSEAAKQAGVEHPVPSVPKAEPRSSIPEVPTAGDEKTVSPTVVASVPLGVLGETHAPLGKIAPVQQDGCVPALGGVHAAEKSKQAGIEPPALSAPEMELEPPSIVAIPGAGGDGSISPKVLASVPLEVLGATHAPLAEIVPVPDDGCTPARACVAVCRELQTCRYSVKVGSFDDRQKAEETKARLEAKGYKAVVRTAKHQMLGKVFVIQLQPVNSISMAATLMAQLSGEIKDEPVIVKIPAQ